MTTATATPPPAAATPGPTTGPTTADTVLELRGVDKTFRDFWLRPRVKAVRDLDLTVKRGEVIGLLGPNGSGKTTTIKMILGLLHPSAGQIAVLGKRPSDVQLKHKIGYLPEESHLYRFLNAEETLDFYGRLFRIPTPERRGRVEALLKMVGLESARYRPVGEYSKGMQRRVGLAQALINDPDLLVLDEPTTGMDPIATRQIKDLILKLRDRGKTILLCTHLLGEVEDVCDRIVIMYAGKIRAAGTVNELLTVEGRQAIEVSGGAIDQETVERLQSVLGEGRHIDDVHPPKQRLEELFLDVIDQATRGGDATTGAAVGGDVAGFLQQDQAGGDALLDSLASGPRPVEPVAPASDDPDRAEAGVPVPEAEPEPDETVLESMGTYTPPAPADSEAEPDSDAKRSDDAPPADADDEFLGSLSSKRD